MRYRNKRHFNALEFLHHNAAKASNGGAISIGNVDRRPWVSRTRHFFQKVVYAEVKLVVARHSNIKRHLIGQVDHILALVKARKDGRREHITIKNIKHVGVSRALSQCNGVYPSNTAAAIVFVKIIDIADAENGNIHGLGISTRHQNRAKCGGTQRHRKFTGREFHADFLPEVIIFQAGPAKAGDRNSLRDSQIELNLNTVFE